MLRATSNSPLTVSLNGVIAISNNTVMMSDAAGTICVWHSFIFASALTLSSGGIVSIGMNSMDLTSVNLISDVFWHEVVVSSTAYISISGDESTFEVAHNIKNTYNLTAGSMSCFVVYSLLNAPVSVSLGGTLSITNNSMSSQQTTLSTTLRLYTLAMFTPIQIFEGSVVTVQDNTNNFTDTKVANGWQMHTLFATTGAPITLSNSSTLNIVGNFFAVSSATGSSLDYVAAQIEEYVLCSGTSTIGVNGNSLVLSEMAVTGDVKMHAFRISINTTLSNGSTLSIRNNSMVATGVEVSAGGGWFVYTMYTYSAPISINANSTLHIAGNHIVVSDVGVVIRLWTLHLGASKTSIENGSTLSIINNNMTFSNVSVVFNNWIIFTMHVISSSMAISSGSTIFISNNHHDAAHVRVDGFWSSFALFIEHSTASIDTTSTLSITNNNVTAQHVAIKLILRSSMIGVSSSSMVIIGESALDISNNGITLEDIHITQDWQMFTIYMEAADFFTLAGASTMDVVSNSFTVSNSSGAGLGYKTIQVSGGIPLSLGDASVLNIDTNSIDEIPQY